MNIVRLNTVADDKIIATRVGGGSGGGASKSSVKYYDCLFDSEEEHGGYYVDNIKVIGESGAIMIAPEAYLEEDSYQRVAVAADMSKKIYMNGEWVNIKDFLIESEGFNPDTHIEITEEEFYHIPTDTVVWNCEYESNCKTAFEELLKLCKRYEGKFGSSNPIPLRLWYKSIDLVMFGASPTHIYSYRDDGDEEYIFLDKYNELALRRQGESYQLIYS